MPPAHLRSPRRPLIPSALRWGSLALTLSGCGSSTPLPFSGFVDSPTSAVAAQVPGVLARVLVQEGQEVHRGELLAELDTRERQAVVAQAEAEVERLRSALATAETNFRATVPTVKGAGADVARAAATLEDAQTNFDRASRLFQAHAVTEAQFTSARARLLEARATLDSLLASRQATLGKVRSALAAVADARAALSVGEAALELARVQLSLAQVRAPFDGRVVNRNLEPGEWVAVTTPILTMENASRLWVRLDVEEDRFSGLRLGMPARIRVVALPGRELEGHVTQIGAQGDFAINRDVKRGRPDLRTFRVRVQFDQPPPDLRPGMTAEVRLLPADAGAAR